MMFISASISSNLYKLYLKSVIDVSINNLINSPTNIHARKWAQRSMKIPPYPPLAKGGWGDFHINSVKLRERYSS